MQEPAIKKALTTFEFLSQDARTRQLYEERQKSLMTYTADMEGAREEGREQGRHEGAVDTARKMLMAGMDASQIADLVDLSLDAVKAIRPSVTAAMLNGYESRQIIGKRPSLLTLFISRKIGPLD